ncbi:hypothetical protein BN946_scf184983.g44 [Trametes cinnabarina]|uniref:Extracellular membrane protein CFEM domain-containing protein n=1 Tax=Pycnoporus cinnabarinus TaxID=5643 RepID=A0A060SEA6_PYCCI|nr:hypothetical protein BN946_scf184983.g44 [Trametes cinnabarina]
MQFSSLLKLALLATQIGVVTAVTIPPALDTHRSAAIFSNCTTDADCTAGETCSDIFGLLDYSICVPSLAEICSLASAST